MILGLTRLFLGLFIMVCGAWLGIVEAYFSAVFSLWFGWKVLPLPRKKGGPLVLGVVLFPLVLWNVTFVEVGLKILDLHCRVLGFMGNSEQGSCQRYAPDSYLVGASLQAGPIFSTREHLGVHGLNLLMAAGGTLSGYQEVAFETLQLARTEPVIETLQLERSERRKQCTEKAKIPTQATARYSDILLRSSTIKRILSSKQKASQKVTPGNPKRFAPELMVFSGASTGSNNATYASLAKEDSLAVHLALLVPGGQVVIEASSKRGVPTYSVLWKGKIFYPSNVKFDLAIPTIWQLPVLQPYTNITEPFPLMLSEAVFCGMQLDGEMNPYQQQWKSEIAVSDPRLSESDKNKPERVWSEELILNLLK